MLPTLMPHFSQVYTAMCPLFITWLSDFAEFFTFLILARMLWFRHCPAYLSHGARVGMNRNRSVDLEYLLALPVE